MRTLAILAFALLSGCVSRAVIHAQKVTVVVSTETKLNVKGLPLP